MSTDSFSPAGSTPTIREHRPSIIPVALDAQKITLVGTGFTEGSSVIISSGNGATVGTCFGKDVEIQDSETFVFTTTNYPHRVLTQS